MKITSKYVLREHLGPLTFALGALTSLLLLNYIARKFGDLVGKGLPWTVVIEFMLLSVPFTFAMTLPMAVLVSTLYAFSRLASENEITAFKASGVAMSRLLGPVLLGATALAGVMIYFNDQVLPASNHRLSTLQQNIGRTSPTLVLKERVINEIGPLLLSATSIDRAKSTLKDVTIIDMSQATPRTIRADSGEIGFLPNKRDLQLTLFDGNVEQLGDQKPEQLQRTQFKVQLTRQRDAFKTFDSSGDATNSFKSDREMSICELQQAYIMARKEYLLARFEFDGALADSLKRRRPPKPKPGRVFLGVGYVYCQAVAAVTKLGVRSAKAQEPTYAVALVQDTVKRDSTRRDSLRADSVRRAAATRDSIAKAVAAPTPAPPAAQPVPAAQIAVPAPGVVPARQSPGVTPLDTANRVAVPLPPSAGGGAAAQSRTDPYAFGNTALALARAHSRETLGTMNNYDVEIHKKFALAAACIVFVLLGAPIALRFPSGGVGLVIGASLLVFATYYSFLIAGENLAGRGMLPPWLAMWGANVLFTIVGLPLALGMGKHSGSTRGGGFGEMIDNLRFRLNERKKPTAEASTATASAS